MTRRQPHHLGALVSLPRYVRLAAELSVLTSSLRDKLALARFAISIPVAQALRGRRPRPATFRLGEGSRITVADRTELLAMRDVLLNEEYAIELDRPPKVIVDAGANVGLASIFFSALWPEARIVAVEADPSTFRRLKENTASLRNVEVVNRAIAARDGEVVFYSAPRTVSSSLVRRSPDQRPVRVMGATLTSLMHDLGIDVIDLLKLDIEGGEFEALEAFSPHLSRLRTVIVEVHGDLQPPGTRAIVDILQGFECKTQWSLPPGRTLIHAKVIPA